MPTASSSGVAPRRSVGVLLLLAGLLVNKWSVGNLVAADGRIDNAAVVAAIVAIQVVCVALGLLLTVRPLSLRPGAVYAGVVAVLLGTLGIGAYGSLGALRIIDADREFREAWQTMEASEEIIRALTPDFGRLSTSIMNLEFPDHHTRERFADRVVVLDLDPAGAEVHSSEVETVALDLEDWRLSRAEQTVANADLAFWRPLFDEIEYFDHAKLKIVRGRFLEGREDRYQTDVAFEALARLNSGRVSWIKGDLVMDWSRELLDTAPRVEEIGPPPQAELTLEVEEEASHWIVTRLETLDIHATAAEGLLFAEVLDAALPGDDLAAARRSIHQEIVLEMLLDPEGFERPNPYFSLPAFDRHPGIAVVDVDEDGWDDLYVTARWGKNQFFRNRGDGTFEEIAAELGLDLEDHTSSALFADFDNDGDQDAFLGRTLARSRYFENVGGRFVDRSEAMPAEGVPFLVSSVVGVDYDRDGLLDVYISTYAANMLTRMGLDVSLDQYLNRSDSDELDRLRAGPDAHKNLNWYGPPNVLLHNEGGGAFSVVEDPGPLKMFKNTYQTTWADIDGDGDQDAYVANDFAPNHLIRNDGSGVFVDITAETATADLGFGMGASWGDYDEDGDQDLYVSNMFSKAGTRITEQLADLDPRFASMARGNSLFANGPSEWEKVSGYEKPKLLVERAGWGWGSQFVDVDNDGYLDLYALSGYYTAPPEVELPIDL